MQTYKTYTYVYIPTLYYSNCISLVVIILHAWSGTNETEHYIYSKNCVPFVIWSLKTHTPGYNYFSLSVRNWQLPHVISAILYTSFSDIHWRMHSQGGYLYCSNSVDKSNMCLVISAIGNDKELDIISMSIFVTVLSFNIS